MSAARQSGIVGSLRRSQYLAIAGVGILTLIVWYVFSDAGRAPVGAACKNNHACQSGICLPDSDPKEVDRFVELIQAYELGRSANSNMAGQIEELLGKLPHSSLNLRPKYPGVCTHRCTHDSDCPEGLFCAEAVWVRALKGLDQDRVQVCMPDEHPAVRLMR